jgi:hypothetical protein
VEAIVYNFVTATVVLGGNRDFNLVTGQSSSSESSWRSPGRTVGDKRRQFKMESSLCLTVAVGLRQFGNPRRVTFAVGSQYQRTGVGKQIERINCVLKCTTKQTIWNSDRAMFEL